MMFKTARPQPAAATQASANLRFFSNLATLAVNRLVIAEVRRVHEAGGTIADVVTAVRAVKNRFKRAQETRYLIVDREVWLPLREARVSEWRARRDRNLHGLGDPSSSDREFSDPIYSDA